MRRASRHAGPPPGDLTMPTYAYRCTECEHAFEIQQAFTDDSLTTCPECSGNLRKLFSGVGVVFKGSGFYRTDSRSGAIASVPAGSSNGGGNGSGSESGGSSGSGSGGSSGSGSGGSDSGSSGSGASGSGSNGSSSGSSSSGSSSSGSSSSSPAKAGASTGS